MKMKLKAPSTKQRVDYEGDTELVYIMTSGQEAVRFNKGEVGYMTVIIDRDGWLGFEFFIPAYEPWNEAIVQFGKNCDNVEAAKSLAEIVLLDIENSTDTRWQQFGFMREDIS